MQPEISVIVPVYKAEKYLYRCVDSILAQTFTNFELILVDDGSPDNSGAICDEYAKKDSRIKVIHKKNGGPSSARNVGLDNAIGEYVCFVDSDDTIDNTFLENFGECKADITIQGFYSKRYKELYEEYQPITEAICNRTDARHMVDILHKANNTGYLWTRAFKREIIEANRLRLNERYRIREDEEFIWRYMCCCNTFATVNKGAYHYDIPDFSSKYKQIDLDSRYECTISIIEHCKQLTGEYSHPHIVNNINRLASIVINSYQKSNFDYSKTKNYLTVFKKYYNKVKGNKILNKKSKIVYNMIGINSPYILHKIYHALFCHI